ncbi:histone-lysine N-methyltransferase SETMAR [Trichonephila clavipes]|nr:histone-lysine N-methyltransferase SETMAR [Trichonephila clavipes]
MEVNKEKIRYILQFFFDKGENASKAAEIVNGVYGAYTVTANYVKFWFHRFRSGIFNPPSVPHGKFPHWPNTKFRYLLSTTGPFEASDCPESANRRGVVFHQDNATSVVTRQILWELGWEVSMHLLYSLDLAPNDYHLFLALQNLQSNKKLGSREHSENRLLEFFANKGQDFYERGNMKLPLKK